nr:MAG TPA: hypothetical protein [Caudoviricetes sp.]
MRYIAGFESPPGHQKEKPRNRNGSPVFLLFSTVSALAQRDAILRFETLKSIICKTNYTRITHGISHQFFSAIPW